MERWLVKLIALLLIFAIVFVFTLLPIKVSKTFIRKGEKGKRIISCFMCFGGGVFLGVYMIHMAPDVRLLLDEVLTIPLGITYPVPDLIIVCGFFLMVFSENFVHACQEKSVETTSNTDSPGQESMVALRLAAYARPTADAASSNDYWGRPLSLTYVDRELKTSKGLETNGEAKKYQEITQTTLTNGHLQTSKQQLNGRHIDNHVADDNVINEDEDVRHRHNTGHHDAHLQVTRSLVLLLALSLHHIFEGLSIGLKQTVASVWNLCAAIIAHEVVIAFSLGMQMVKTYKHTSKVVIAALICSAMVPLGMVIGIALTESGNQQTPAMLILNGTLQGLATGVFIYVTFFEILQQELGNGKADFVKLTFMLAGFAVLALLALIPEDKGYSLHHQSTTENNTANCSCLLYQ